MDKSSVIVPGETVIVEITAYNADNHQSDLYAKTVWKIMQRGNNLKY